MFNDTPARKQIAYWVTEQEQKRKKKPGTKNNREMKRCGVYKINNYLVFTQVFHLQGPHLETYSSLTKRLYLSVYGTVYFSYLQVLKYNDHKLNISPQR